MTYRWGDLGRLLAAWVAATIALALTAWIVPGFSASSFWCWPLAAAAAAAVGFFLRPILVAVSARIGWVAVLLVTLFGQAVVLGIALSIVPGVHVADGWTLFFAAWVSAIVGTVVAWVTSAGTDDALMMSLLRKRPGAKPDDADVDGVVFVQMDGVPFPVLRWAVQAGSVPTIRGWLLSGKYVLREWTPQLPCTTPASQLGILHGTIDRVPAFRWYDRELGRLLVANRPADAAVIEARASDGRGLLADDGVSVSNLFTGDAERTAMTMSRLNVSRGSAITRKSVAWFLARPDGFARSIARTIAEIVKERFQAKRQERRNLVPRTERGWTFAVLRSITNALLRDLNTAVVADEMLRGTRSVYVDYVDYDEIAHHAGLFRPESLAALDGVDRVLATLEKVAARAPRRYHIVVLSDHGQAQGQPFAARFGYDLASLCERLTQVSVASVDKSVEGWGRAESIVDDVASSGGISGKLAKRAGKHVHEQVDDDADADAETSPPSDLTIVGSGNLGLLFQHGPTRMTLEQIEERWPALVPGLAGHEGVSFVAAITEAGHAVAIGPEGRVDLDDGTVEGVNPLGQFGDHAGPFLARAVKLAEAPDLYINSSLDPTTLDVAAFEPLVGCHGGLGGWQDSAMFLCPSELHEESDDAIHGADHLHQVLVGILERLGHRRDLTAPAAASDPEESRHAADA